MKKINFSSFTPYRDSKVPFVKLNNEKNHFSSFAPYLSADRPNNDFFRKFLENISQSKNTVRFFLYVGVYPVLYIRSFQFQQMLVLLAKFCLFQHIL